MSYRRIPPPPAMTGNPALYRWQQDLWRQLSDEQIIPSLRYVSSSTTLLVDDYTVVLQPSGSTITLSLPPASTMTFRPLYFKNYGSGSAVIFAHGGEHIDGIDNAVLSVASSLHLQSTGTKWFILGRR